MKLTAFVTHPGEILILVPQASRAPPRKPLDSFFDTHARTPFLVAAEEGSPYESIEFNRRGRDRMASFHLVRVDLDHLADVRDCKSTFSDRSALCNDDDIAVRILLIEGDRNSQR